MKFVKLICIIVLFTACASKEGQGKKNFLSQSTLKSSLIIGKTQKSDVIKTFGAPEMVNQTARSGEQWVYMKSATEWNDKASSIGASGFKYLTSSALGISLDVGNGTTTREHKSKTLEIRFNSKGTLIDYSFSSSRI